MQTRPVHVVFPATGAERAVERLRVAFRDTSRADAAAVVLAEATTGPLTVPADGMTVDVPVEVSDVAAQAIGALGRGEVTVFVHGAAAERDDIEEGDFLSTVSVTLPPAGDIDVPVTYLPVSDRPPADR